MIKKIALICAGLLFNTVIFAGIMVEPIVIDTYSAKGTTGKHADLRVINEDNENNAYITLHILTISHPGTPEQKETLLKDPKTSGIFVSPKKFIIAPGAFRNVRIGFNQLPTQSDNVYRIVVSPSASLKEHLEKEEKAEIDIVVAYGVLVIERPAKPVLNIVVERKGTALTVTNKGNTSVDLVNARQCDTQGKCTSIDLVDRLYVGNVWKTTLKQALPVKFTELVGSQAREVESN